jgi:DNA-binding transcriptional ArsR family regulator
MTARQAVAVMAALGHSLRLELWRLLVPYGSTGLSAGLIATSLAVPPSSLSFHLQQMTHAGILTQRRFSRQIIYAVNQDTMEELCSFLLSHEPVSSIPAATILSAGEAGDIVG